MNPPNKAKHAYFLGDRTNRGRFLASFTLLALAVGIPFGAACRTQAATITAASPLIGDVTVALSRAVDGDTVVIPAGVVTWTGWTTRYGLDIQKAITLQGAGVGRTIIKNGGGGTGSLGGTYMIHWILVANKPSRMTGIEFQDIGAPLSGNGVIGLSGGSYSPASDTRTMRVDHCKFDHLNGFTIESRDIIGVIDNNTFLGANTFLYIYNQNWNQSPGGTSDASWSDSSHFGSSQFLFIENNVMTLDSQNAAIDGYSGTRWVFRYNTVTRGHLEIHGTDSAVRARGGRAGEVYNNSFTGPTPGDYVINARSGVFIVHDNTTTGVTNPALHLACYRLFFPFGPWATADGTSQWDVNATESDGVTNIPGHSPYLFYSGIATGGSSTTAIVARASWATNQWVGYSIKKTSNNGIGQVASEITANTATTITYGGTGGFDFGNPNKIMTFAAGDTFEIHKVLQAMDQPGRSGGSLITGSTPVLPTGWNDQITDPCYEWNNTKTEGGSFHFIASEPVIRSGEHYFSNTQAPGYTPYTYPHPLVSGGSAQPAAPKDLRVLSRP